MRMTGWEFLGYRVAHRKEQRLVDQGFRAERLLWYQSIRIRSCRCRASRGKRASGHCGFCAADNGSVDDLEYKAPHGITNLKSGVKLGRRVQDCDLASLDFEPGRNAVQFNCDAPER